MSDDRNRRLDEVLATVVTTDYAIAEGVQSIVALGADLTPELIHRLSPPRPAVLSWAQMLCLVRALAAHSTADALTFLKDWADRIVESDGSLGNDDELDLGFEALDSLGRIDIERVAERLRGWIRAVNESWDSTLVWHLIDAFAPHANTTDVDLLRRFLTHADWDVRKAADGAMRRASR